MALAVFFVCSGPRLIAQTPPSGPGTALDDLAVAFEAARREEVPIFAPKLYTEAVGLFQQAETAERNCEPIETVRAAIARAEGALKKALRASESSRRTLAEASQARAQAKSYPFVTLLSEKLDQAETAYQTALSQAEAGDLQAAESSAARAVELYRELTLRGLREGPLTKARLLLQKNEARLSQDSLAQKLAELAALDAAVEKTEGEAFEIRSYVALTQAEIQAIIGSLFPGFYTKLPERLLIGDFTIVVDGKQIRLYPSSSGRDQFGPIQLEKRNLPSRLEQPEEPPKAQRP